MYETMSIHMQVQKPHTGHITNPIIETIIQQMGGRGLRGAFAYIGASQLAYKAHGDYGYPGRRSRINEDGTISYETGLSIRVNGKPRRAWTIIVAYEPDDTYSVYLWQLPERKKRDNKAGEILDSYHDVYCDQLQGIVESTYDNAIKQHNEGFIPLGGKG